jgi:hypothetical protein
LALVQVHDMLAPSKTGMPMTIDIQPVKLDGQHWVNVIIGGHEMERRGPYPDADAAELAAERLRRFGRALTSSGGKGG